MRLSSLLHLHDEDADLAEGANFAHLRSSLHERHAVVVGSCDAIHDGLLVGTNQRANLDNTTNMDSEMQCDDGASAHSADRSLIAHCPLFIPSSCCAFVCSHLRHCVISRQLSLLVEVEHGHVRQSVEWVGW